MNESSRAGKWCLIVLRSVTEIQFGTVCLNYVYTSPIWASSRDARDRSACVPSAAADMIHLSWRGMRHKDLRDLVLVHPSSPGTVSSLPRRDLVLAHTPSLGVVSDRAFFHCPPTRDFVSHPFVAYTFRSHFYRHKEIYAAAWGARLTTKADLHPTPLFSYLIAPARLR